MGYPGGFEMGRLLALGEGSAKYPGEALVWTHSSTPYGLHIRTAVDVGKTSDMGRSVALSSPAVLVLTHDDHDHIGGWSGFAELGLETLREIWLPYEWGGLLRVLATTRIDVVDPQVTPEDMFSVVRVRADDADERRDSELENEDEEGAWAERAEARYVEIVDDDQVVGRLGGLLSDVREQLLGDDGGGETWIGTPREIARRALRRARRIAEIVGDCHRGRVTIKWFSVDHYPDLHSELSGPRWITGWGEAISIANADRVRFRHTRQQPSGLDALALSLALTVQNRRALCPVLWSPFEARPRVLVWSDSSGEWTGRSGVKELIALIDGSTAPHHGSTVPAHDAAWRALEPFLQKRDTVMLLAGGESTQAHVREEYTSLPSQRRGCTRCRHSPGVRSTPQTVGIRFSDSGHQIHIGACRA